MIERYRYFVGGKIGLVLRTNTNNSLSAPEVMEGDVGNVCQVSAGHRPDFVIPPTLGEAGFRLVPTLNTRSMTSPAISGYMIFYNLQNTIPWEQTQGNARSIAATWTIVTQSASLPHGSYNWLAATHTRTLGANRVPLAIFPPGTKQPSQTYLGDTLTGPGRNSSPPTNGCSLTIQWAKPPIIHDSTCRARLVGLQWSLQDSSIYSTSCSASRNKKASTNYRGLIG